MALISTVDENRPIPISTTQTSGEATYSDRVELIEETHKHIAHSEEIITRGFRIMTPRTNPWKIPTLKIKRRCETETTRLKQRNNRQPSTDNMSPSPVD